METNKIDKVFKDAFQNRTLEPSTSAWDRLSQKLDTEEKKQRKKGFVVLGYAASILALIAFSYSYLTEEPTTSEKTNVEIVDIDKTEKVAPSEFVSEKPAFKIKSKVANAAVEKIILKKSIRKEVKQNVTRVPEQFQNIEDVKDSQIAEIHKVQIDTLDVYIASTKTNASKKTPKRIKINPLDLLNSIENKNTVATSDSDVLSRVEKLKIIEQELKNKNISISPEKLLAEVEADTKEKSFRGKFLKSIKNNISTLATAITERNK